MRRIINGSRWVFAGVTLLGLGGCVSNQQLLDFTRMEFSRVVADILGRTLSLYVQGVA